MSLINKEGAVCSGIDLGAMKRYVEFLNVCCKDSECRLTPLAEPSPFARCFCVFGYQLAHILLPAEERATFARDLREAVRHARRGRDKVPTDKGYRQFLTFSLSALAALGLLSEDPLEELVVEQIPENMATELQTHGCLEGRPQSGNQAMFMAIFLLHARDYLGVDTNDYLDQWVNLHLGSMNRFGFWGVDKGMTHLQFQNGYHQYEILSYMGVENPCAAEAVAAVRSLADPTGHFAPYPGGGGCYDYDAVFVLTPNGMIPDEVTKELLLRTAATIRSEQQFDGGFAESLYIRPRSLTNWGRFSSHIGRAVGNKPLFWERLRYGLALQRSAHDRICTHWSRYSRCWNESDLWDSWFRMLALARIEVALDPSTVNRWGFIEYPGIGYHPLLRHIVKEEA